MAKVYCIACKHYIESKDVCDAPDNLEDTYLIPFGRRKDIPSNINRDNYCTWYEKRSFR